MQVLILDPPLCKRLIFGHKDLLITDHYAEAAGSLTLSITTLAVEERSSSLQSFVFSHQSVALFAKLGKNSSLLVFLWELAWVSKEPQSPCLRQKTLLLGFVVPWSCPGSCGRLLVSS